MFAPGFCAALPVVMFWLSLSRNVDGTSVLNFFRLKDLQKSLFSFGLMLGFSSPVGC